MLDLDAIFNPDHVPPALPKLECGPGLQVEDLPGDWRVEWEERAAIMEYDGKLPRERAEALALDDILRRMKEAGIRLPGYT